MEKETFDTWDAYFIPGTQTLKNKLNIRDAAKLRTAEYEITQSALEQIEKNPVPGNYDLDHLKAIHKQIFQDVYEWAGQIRSVGIAKGNSEFARPEYIESEGKKISRALAEDKDINQPPDKRAFVERLADHYSDWNALHPFREGNGRSTRVFMEYVARRAGYSLDQRRIDAVKERWNHAASQSMAGQLEPIKQIFMEAVRPQRAVDFENLPRETAYKNHPELRDSFMLLRIERAQLALAHPTNPQAVDHFMRQKTTEILRVLDMGKVPALTPEQKRNADAASAFLGKSPREAAQEHPALAGPLATLGAYKAALDAQGIEQAQREQALTNMRQALADRILTGQYRSVQTQQMRFQPRNAAPEATNEQSPL